jgi:hypothetical protein
VTLANGSAWPVFLSETFPAIVPFSWPHAREAVSRSPGIRRMAIEERRGMWF